MLSLFLESSLNLNPKAGRHNEGTSCSFPVVHVLNRGSEASYSNGSGTPGPPFQRFGSSNVRCRCWLLVYRQKCFTFYEYEEIALAQAPSIASEDGVSLEQFPPLFSAVDESPVGQQIFQLGSGRARLALGLV
ncbi:hypothetical protein CEXT_419611 [Caerostris extrusa]|uniref:Uncharacterized protein n=1 Tax=Caerostris extrusa TaxID=172846 RepID=A0AAV4MMC0_CAEEX|nr:hypothetical protein CEXT_419611 [Caerostris extrusa]